MTLFKKKNLRTTIYRCFNTQVSFGAVDFVCRGRVFSRLISEIVVAGRLESAQ